MTTPSITTPERDVFAGEVVEGDVIMTEHGPRPVHSAVRLGDMVHLYYRVPKGTDSIVRPVTSTMTIRDVAVVSAPARVVPFSDLMVRAGAEHTAELAQVFADVTVPAVQS